eukprot:2990030-Pleurochrysis_carterae.AAC.2
MPRARVPYPRCVAAVLGRTTTALSSVDASAAMHMPLSRFQTRYASPHALSSLSLSSTKPDSSPYFFLSSNFASSLHVIPHKLAA